METIKIIVTRPKGSWRWQDAYALSTYARLSPSEPWRFIERSRKFPKTRAYAWLWEKYPVGRAALPARQQEAAA